MQYSSIHATVNLKLVKVLTGLTLSALALDAWTRILREKLQLMACLEMHHPVLRLKISAIMPIEEPDLRSLVKRCSVTSYRTSCMIFEPGIIPGRLDSHNELNTIVTVRICHTDMDQSMCFVHPSVHVDLPGAVILRPATKKARSRLQWCFRMLPWSVWGTFRHCWGRRRLRLGVWPQTMYRAAGS